MMIRDDESCCWAALSLEMMLEGLSVILKAAFVGSLGRLTNTLAAGLPVGSIVLLLVLSDHVVPPSTVAA